MSERSLTYFISDLHLGAKYISDPRQHEAIITRWLRSIAPTAKRLYLLGDVMDYWFEYRSVVPRGHVRFLGALAELADAGVEVTWLKGNHDIWIYDYIPSELGVKVVDGILLEEIDGKTFVMEHGDGCGEMRRSYRAMRRLFRCRACQRLFAMIHPGLTVPFAHSWSSHSRKAYTAPVIDQLATDDALVVFAEQYLRQHGHVDYFIFGHRHQLIEQKVGSDSHLIILGDAFKLFSYAVFDGQELRLCQMTK